MLPAYKGRLNRKTFVLGNIIGLCILGFLALIYIVPIAIVDILVSGAGGSSPIFKVLYSFFAIPSLFFFFYFSVLFVKRMHDIGYPGLLLLWIFIILQVVSTVISIWFLNILAFVVVLIVCAFPGQKVRNNFGPKPGKKFQIRDLIVRF